MSTVIEREGNLSESMDQLIDLAVGTLDEKTRVSVERSLRGKKTFGSFVFGLMLSKGFSITNIEAFCLETGVTRQFVTLLVNGSYITPLPGERRRHAAFDPRVKILADFFGVDESLMMQMFVNAREVSDQTTAEIRESSGDSGLVVEYLVKEVSSNVGASLNERVTVADCADPVEVERGRIVRQLAAELPAIIRGSLKNAIERMVADGKITINR